jgi:hypothetical protein
MLVRAEFTRLFRSGFKAKIAFQGSAPTNVGGYRFVDTLQGPFRKA